MEKFRVNAKKIEAIPNGINPKEFKGLKIEMKSSCKTVLYVGTLEKYKGVDYLIKALPRLDKGFCLEIVEKAHTSLHY